MTCSFNEWVAAPDSMKSGEHVSMLLDQTPVCLSSHCPSQLLLMRPWCHSDHTCCRLLLNLFPRSLKNTHTCMDRNVHTQPGSIFAQGSHCNQRFPIHPTCFGSLPSFQSVLSNGQAEVYLNPRAVGEDTSSGMCRGHLRLPWIVHTQVGVNLNLLERV